jgi:hypothetical protein
MLMTGNGMPRPLPVVPVVPTVISAVVSSLMGVPMSVATSVQ